MIRFAFRFLVVREVYLDSSSSVLKMSASESVFFFQEYDFVFDVEIQEGAPRMKLPYNLTGM